jgi:hypothetical protein
MKANDVIKDLKSKIINRQLALYLYELYKEGIFKWIILLDVGCGTGMPLEISQPI